MKIIDNNGRLFGRISIIDVIVILVVAVLAVALYLKNNTYTHTSTATADSEIGYQILVRGVPEYVADHLHIGDKVFDADRMNSGCLGEITGWEVSEGNELAEFMDGTSGLAPSEDTVNLLIDVKGSGIVTEGRYMLNRVYDLGVNAGRNFATTYAYFMGHFYSIG